LHISFIVYPKEANRMQARFAVDGAFHVEPLNYYVKPPSEWRERAWLVLLETAYADCSIFSTGGTLKSCMHGCEKAGLSWNVA